MKAKIEKKNVPFKADYTKEDYEIARNFSKQIYKEFGAFIRAIVIFGGHREHKKKGDIDLLIIVDNVSFYLTPEVIETYRIVTERIAFDTSKRLHITTLRFTSFWEYMRVGDPLGINILRTGVALIDTGFFYPLQLMLFEGRIRPTPESVQAYMSRSASTLHNSKWHIMQAALDLYWSVIDATHAALMRNGEIPPSPKDAGNLIKEVLVKKRQVNRICPKIMQDFYLLSRKILHREIKEISGKEFDKWYEKAKYFTDQMKKVKQKVQL